jgi:uncharacterized protein YraI
MKFLKLSLSLFSALVTIYPVFGFVTQAVAGTFAQQAPTPTASPSGVLIATVNVGDNPDINVRAGPSQDYAIIGKLLAGQQVPALGRSPGGDWVQISYPQGPGGIGWVYAYLVTVNGILPIVELPPTPTPRVTPTIDPTLAAQFIREPLPTRLPTFTSPPPLVIPTFPAPSPIQAAGGAPLMYAMLFLAGVGLIGILLSLIRVR